MQSTQVQIFVHFTKRGYMKGLRLTPRQQVIKLLKKAKFDLSEIESIVVTAVASEFHIRIPLTVGLHCTLERMRNLKRVVRSVSVSPILLAA